MKKPITVIIDELKVNIVNEINKSNLPIWIVKDILKDFTIQAEQIATEQAKADREAWDKEKENGLCED